MKKLQLVAGLAVVLPVFLFSTVVLAETAPTTTNSSDASVSSPAQTEPANPGQEEETTLEQRITEYKAALTIAPTTAQQATIKAKCKPAQAINKALITRVTATDKTRVQVYGDVTSILETIVPRIKEAKVDVESLTKQQAELTDIVTEYLTSVATYKTVLSDLDEVDCVADPVAFKATLEAARTARTVVNNSMVAVKQYANETIKPSLAEAKASLSDDTEKDAADATTTKEEQ